MVLDLRPLAFTEGHGMADFSEAVFKAGQSVPAGVGVQPTASTALLGTHYDQNSRNSLTAHLSRRKTGPPANRGNKC